MQPIDSTIYGVCIRGEGMRYTAHSRIVPIMGHSISLSEKERKDLREGGFVFDDENAYYSCLNPWWGELSCIHWMLLNAEESNIGNAQYRRNWIEPEGYWYDENTLYFPEPAIFSCSLEQQFYGGHSAFDAPAITRQLADSGAWLFSREQIDKVWAQNTLIGCNMARGPKHAYKHFMSRLFDALMPMWRLHGADFLFIEGYDKRALAFTAERIITGMVLYRDELFPGMNIGTAPIGFIG